MSVHDITVSLLDAIGAAIIAAVITFVVSQHFAKHRNNSASVQEAATNEASQKSAPSAGGTKIEKTSSEEFQFGKFNQEAVLALIQTRRSIFPKDFDDVDDADTASLPRESIDLLFEAANWAPCHGKNEPWRFVVVSRKRILADFPALESDVWSELLKDDPEKLDKKFKKMKKKAKARSRCPYTIFICLKRVPSRKGNLMPEWEDQAAVACAVQNLHLMATALGIAGYWSSGGVGSFYDHEKVKSYLGLGDDERCLGTFVLGSSKKANSYRASRQPAADKVTWIQ